MFTYFKQYNVRGNTMLWTAVLKDQEVITNDDLIYHDIKNRIDDLVSLTAQVNDRDYTLMWKTKEFITGPVRFNFAIKGSDNIRPICFVQEQIAFTFSQATGALPPPTTSGIGLGYQVTLPNGKTQKHYILIHPDGTFTIGD